MEMPDITTCRVEQIREWVDQHGEAIAVYVSADVLKSIRSLFNGEGAGMRSWENIKIIDDLTLPRRTAVFEATDGALCILEI